MIFNLATWLGTYKKGKEFFKKFFPRIYCHKTIVKYIFSGGTAAFADFSLLYILTDFFEIWYVFSATIAFAVSFFISFVLQKFWTFRDGDCKKIYKQIFLYVSIGLLNLSINAGAVYIIVENTGLWYMFAQAIVGITLAGGSFLFYKFVIFVKKKKRKKYEVSYK